MQNVKRIQLVPIVVMLLAFVGLYAATFVSYKTLSGTEIGTCPIFGSGCGDVLHSKYSTFLGIPLAYYGVVFYIGMILLSVLLISTKRKVFKSLLALGAIVGFLDTGIFIYIQGFLIGAYCFYCVVSAVAATLMFFAMLSTIIDHVFDWSEKRSLKTNIDTTQPPVALPLEDPSDE